VFTDPAVTLASDQPVLMCGHGERAMTGASLLERNGARPAVFLDGPLPPT
jgi:hypothetical protein